MRGLAAVRPLKRNLGTQPMENGPIFRPTCKFCRPKILTVILRRLLRVVEGDLLPLFYVPPGEETDHGELRVQAVDPHVEDAEVGVTAMVYEVGGVAVEEGVDRVRVLVTGVEVEVKEVGAAFGV